MAPLISADAKVPDVTSWKTESGMERLGRSRHKVDFFELANNFEGQPNALMCGPTTAVIILNALRKGKEIAPKDRTTFNQNWVKCLRGYILVSEG